jgi:osmotically-inducible protein OsmY
MRRIIPHSFPLSVPAIAVVTVLAAACSPSERQQASNDTRQATNTASNEMSKAASGAARAVDDASVTARVKSVLLADAQVKGTKINVDTSNGVVTLGGSVDSASEKARAEQLAQQVDGVKQVHNNLSAP